MGKAILLAGASGEIGKRLLQNLIARNDVDQIHLINRRSLEINNVKVIEHQVDFEQLDLLDLKCEFDQAFCCLGSTIKKAGSKVKFETIDLHYVHSFAQLAKHHKTAGFCVISSIGATLKTNNFYLLTKGRMEKSVSNMGFTQLLIFRPSLLMGKRDEFRLGEIIGGFAMQLFNPIMIGKLKKYRPTNMDALAKAMACWDKTTASGVCVLEGQGITDLAKP